MEYEDVTRIACPLILRLKRNERVSAKFQEVFGRPITCNLEDAGGNHILVTFLQNEIELDEQVAIMADHIRRVHSAPTRTFGKKVHRTAAPVLTRPGSLLSWSIYKITGESACAACSRRIQTMNEWGWVRCWMRRNEIAQWLVDEARKRGYEIDGSGAISLIKSAYSAAKRKVDA